MMKYKNFEVVKTPLGVEVEENSVWRFDEQLNLMILINNESITMKPNMLFERIY